MCLKWKRTCRSPRSRPPVQQGLATAARRGTIGRVESLTKHGKLVAYETVVTAGTKHREVQVGPDGKRLAHPE